MRTKKILVFLGHPNADSICGSLASEYERGAREAGHEVRRVNVGDLTFDPILHKGYKEIQPLEPDLVKTQDDFRWAEHIVLVYPNWWGAAPALLKGFFDRALLPGFGFRFRKNGFGWDKLLKGRTGRIINTMHTHPWLATLFFGDESNEMRRATLGFTGIWPIRLLRLSGVENMSDAKRARVFAKVHKLGRNAS